MCETKDTWYKSYAQMCVLSRAFLFVTLHRRMGGETAPAPLTLHGVRRRRPWSSEAKIVDPGREVHEAPSLPARCAHQELRRGLRVWTGGYPQEPGSPAPSREERTEEHEPGSEDFAGQRHQRQRRLWTGCWRRIEKSPAGLFNIEYIIDNI